MRRWHRLRLARYPHKYVQVCRWWCGCCCCCCWGTTPPPPPTTMMMTLMELIMSAPGSRNRCNKRNCNISLNQFAMRMAYRIYMVVHSYTHIGHNTRMQSDPCDATRHEASVPFVRPFESHHQCNWRVCTRSTHEDRFHDLHPVSGVRLPQSHVEMVGGVGGGGGGGDGVLSRYSRGICSDVLRCVGLSSFHSYCFEKREKFFRPYCFTSSTQMSFAPCPTNQRTNICGCVVCVCPCMTH